MLIVDDNPDVVFTMQGLLSLLGYRVEAFTDGATAVTAASSLQPDVALLDLGMPEMDGFQVADGLKRVAPATTLIACTAWGDEKIKRKTAAAGFAVHLIKPVAGKDLEEALLNAARS